MYNTTIDLSFKFYKSYHVTKAYYNLDLDLTKEVDRGFLMRKVVTDLCKTSRELQSDRTFIACDSPSFRKTIFSGYKDRGEKEPGFRESQQELIDILASKGLNTIQIEGLEADDLMALVHNKLINERQNLVTGDEDLRQLLDVKTYVFNDDNKKKTFFYYDDIQLKYKPKEGIDFFYTKIDPFYVFFTKLIKGCSTDSVPPIAPKGFRTTKIEKMYADYLEVMPYNLIDEELILKICNQHFPLTKNQLDLQLRLICLRPEYMPSKSVEEFERTFKIKDTEVVWDMKEILRGTPYIDENYGTTTES